MKTKNISIIIYTAFAIAINIQVFPLSSNSLTPRTPQSIITWFEQRDLELVSSHNKSHAGVIAQLGSPITEFGKRRMHRHFTNLTATTATLEKRQKAIKTLVENKQLTATVSLFLSVIKEHQDGILFFLEGKITPAEKQILDSYFFENKALASLNQNSMALTLRDAYAKMGLLTPFLEYAIFHVILDQVSDRHAHGCGCALHSDSTSYIIKAFKAWHIWGVGTSLYETHKLLAVQNSALKNAHTNLAKVKTCFETIKKLCLLLESIDPIMTALPKLKHNLLLNQHQNDDLFQELESLLAGKTCDFDNSPGFFSKAGPVLRAHQLLQKLMSHYTSIIDAIGDLDAFTTIAKLMQKHDKSAARFCFVDFVQTSDKPVLSMHGLWNVMLSPSSAVLNTIDINSPDYAGVNIITGPNKSGKSSVLKAVGTNIVLAQSFGIAAAQKATITPFHKLLTYIIVTDDITKNQSTMVAEVARSQECIDSIAALQDNQFACCLIDDSLFKGTTFQKGQELAHDFIKALGHNKQSCGFVATHTMQITSLAKKYPGLFANLHIPLVSKKGRKQSSFLLAPGIADPKKVLTLIEQDKRQKSHTNE